VTNSRYSPRTTLQHQLHLSGPQTLESPDPGYAMQLPDLATIYRIYDEVANGEGQPSGLAANLRAELSRAQELDDEALQALVEQWRESVSRRVQQQQVIDLLVASLKVPSFDEWLDYWRRGGRFDQVNALLLGIFASMKNTMALAEFTDQQRSLHDHMVAHFESLPDLHEMLCFADRTLSGAGRIVSAMVHRQLKDEERRKQDALNADVFNWNVGWYRVAANALSAVAHGLAPTDVSPDLLLRVAVFAREAALNAYHEASEGRRLRDEEDAATATPGGDVTPTPPHAGDPIDDSDLADVAEYIENYERS
jgi:hypothetical protein